jgi:hypothetical protein
MIGRGSLFPRSSFLHNPAGLGLHYALAVSNNSKTNKNTDEPRWLVLVATLAAALIYAALPSNLSAGPRWLLLAVMVAVVIPHSSHIGPDITPPTRCLGI